MFFEKVEQFLSDFAKINDEKLVSYDYKDFSDTMVKIKVETTNNGFFIGKNGRTLKDIEILLNTMARIDNFPKKIQLNVGDYREKHEETIKKKAVEKAEYVSKTGRIFAFEAMNSYERRLIHTAINESVYGILVKTESVGEGKERHTVIRSK